MNVSTPTRTSPGPSGVLNADQAVERFLRLSGRHGVLPAEVLALYRPVVDAAGRRGTARWLAARHLVATGGSKIPTVAEIDAEEARLVARREQQTADAHTVAQAGAAQARAYVTAVRAATGAGPTWAELGQHLGWSGLRGKTCVRYLIAQGHLTAGVEERSLSVPLRDEDSCELASSLSS